MSRVFAGIISSIAWFALVLQFVLMMGDAQNQSIPVAERIVRFFSFFTILTNLAVACSTAAIAFLPNSRIGRFAAKPSIQAAVAVYIAIVGVVYSLFLRAVWDPIGWHAFADHLLHDVVPIAYVLHWIAYAPKARIGWVEPLKWMIYPFCYVVYSLARGAVAGWYPYWFVDVTKLGYPSALTNTALVLVAFVGFGYVFTMFARLFARTGSEAAARE